MKTENLDRVHECFAMLEILNGELGITEDCKDLVELQDSINTIEDYLEFIIDDEINNIKD